MNTRQISLANDPDLRLSPQAMQRAALRARELAARTGTAIVVSHDGVIEEISPQAGMNAPSVQETVATYGKVSRHG